MFNVNQILSLTKSPYTIHVLCFRRGAHVVVDGQTLSIGDVVAVARHGVVVQLSSDPTVREDVNASRKAIESKLAEGKSVYGLTTGALIAGWTYFGSCYAHHAR